MEEKTKITVGQLIDHLAVFSREAEVFFGGSEDALTFNRTKLRGENLVQIEFNEQVYRNELGEVVVDELRRA